MPDLSSTSGVTKPWLITTVLWFLGASLFTWANLRMPDGGVDLLGDGQKRAHAQEEGERHVLDEHGLR